MRLFVGNIPFEASERELRDAFAPFGCSKAEIVCSPETKIPRGFGFVDVTDALALKAIAEMGAGFKLRERRLFVERAKMRRE